MLSNAFSDDVVISECFCRDGLQHEKKIIPTELKLDLLQRIAQAGFRRIEATSYANPNVIPQFSDASQMLSGLKDLGWLSDQTLHLKATCPNLRAVERALSDKKDGYGATELSFLVSASESHSQKNLRRSRHEQWKNIAAMAELAGNEFRIIGTVSVALGCPFEQYVNPEVVLQDVLEFRRLGIRYISIGDTTGMGTPATTKSLFNMLIKTAPDVTFIAHFHDSRGTALVNYLAAYEAGVRYFDSAIGGVGGHPGAIKYGHGYTGNACTEDLVGLFESCGINTGIHLDLLMEVSKYCENILGRTLDSYVAKSGWNPLMPTVR